MSDATNPPRAPPGRLPSNPYAPPRAEIGEMDPDAPADAVEIRREFLRHESSVRAIGKLYLVIFGLTGVIASAEIAALIKAAVPGTAETGGFSYVGLVAAALTWIAVGAGHGLRDLDPKVRTRATVLSVFSLLAIPIGTIFGGYTLYLLHSEKGRRVFEPSYREVVRVTPRLEPRIPVQLWILVVTLLIAQVVLAFFVDQGSVWRLISRSGR